MAGTDLIPYPWQGTTVVGMVEPAPSSVAVPPAAPVPATVTPPRYGVPLVPLILLWVTLVEIVGFVWWRPGVAPIAATGLAVLLGVLFTIQAVKR